MFRCLLIIFIVLSAFFAMQSFALGDTIVLNDGRKIEGLIVEKSDSYVKVDFEGVELKFYNKDIKEIVSDGNQNFVITEKYTNLEQASLVEKVLESAKIKEQVEYIPTYIADEYAQHKQRVNPQVFDTGSKIMVDSYSSKELYKAVVEYFENNFNRDYLLALSGFFNSPIYKKVSNLEKKVSNSGSVEDMKKFGKELELHPPTKERSELIKKLDDAIGTTNLQIETMVTMYQGMAQAIDPIVDPDKRLRPGELDKLTEQMRIELKNILKNVIAVSFLYTYQSLSDEELKQYINFWSSDAGKWFNRISSQAFISAMNKASAKAELGFVKLAQDTLPKDTLSKPQVSESDNELIYYKKGDKWIKK